MLRLFFLTAILGTLVVSSQAAPRAEEPIILPPTPLATGEEAALLIVPGAYINAQFYQPLGEAIQAASNLKLWVGLVRPFPLDLPNPINIVHDLDNTLQMMRDQGMTTTNLFLSGHSLGGTVLQNQQWSDENGILAWIMFASYLPEDHLANNTLPVMHISGDLDGMTRITRIMHTFRELMAMVDDDPEAIYEKPVVVLEDVNHMHFASGDPPSLVAQEDILSPMSQEDAQSLLAQHISAYITVISGYPEEEMITAKSTLMQDYANTDKIMQPIVYLTDVSEGDGMRSLWTEFSQRIISTVLPEYQDSLQVTDTLYDTVDLFGNSKPKVELVGETAVVSTGTHVYPPGLLEALGDLAASELGVKFKSREAIMETLQPLGVEFGDMTTCKDLNENAFALALNWTSDVSMARFDARGGQATFHPDDEKITGAGWLYGHLHYNLTDNNLDVTSPTLVTGVDVGLGLGGMHYCKLLAPSRALEYIMVDSLKHTSP